MFCANCGNQLPEHAKFCPKCGHSLDDKERSGQAGSGFSGANTGFTSETGQTGAGQPGTAQQVSYTFSGTRGDSAASSIVAFLAAVLMILPLFVMFIAIGAFMKSPQFGFTMSSFLEYFMPDFEVLYIIIYVSVVLLFLIGVFANSFALAMFGCIVGWMAVLMWLIVMATINGEYGFYTISYGFFSLIAGAILETVALALIPTDDVNHSGRALTSDPDAFDFHYLPADLNQLNSCDEEVRYRFSVLSRDNFDMRDVIEASRRSFQEITGRINELQARRSKLSAMGGSTQKIDDKLLENDRELNRARELLTTYEAKFNENKEKMRQYIEYRRTLSHRRVDIIQACAEPEHRLPEAEIAERHKQVDTEFNELMLANGLCD